MTERPEKGSHVKKHIGNYSFFFIPIKRELKLGYGLVPTRTVLIWILINKTTLQALAKF